MKVKLFEFQDGQFVAHAKTQQVHIQVPQLVLTFGEKDLIRGENFYISLRALFPKSEIAICSTAGEITDTVVSDGGAIVTAFEFADTKVQTASVNIADFTNSRDAGIALTNKLLKEDLSYILVLSDGALVNGSELILGISSVTPESVIVTGGLAADGINFQSTGVGLNQTPASGEIICIGFYGQNLQIGHGSMGGWDLFGPEKTVTKSSSNVLFEIDHKNALVLYKEYLGKYAENLPWSALLFPLALTMEGSEEMLVRTILSIDEDRQCLTFAGDIPEGAKVRMMKANFERLIDAASEAATKSYQNLLEQKPEYALLISCVGRKIIFKSRIDEEVEAVAEVFGDQTVMSGFYSNGELSPFNESGQCQLHNQTMTITTFSERLN